MPNYTIEKTAYLEKAFFDLAVPHCPPMYLESSSSVSDFISLGTPVFFLPGFH